MAAGGGDDHRLDSLMLAAHVAEVRFTLLAPALACALSGIGSLLPSVMIRTALDSRSATPTVRPSTSVASHARSGPSISVCMPGRKRRLGDR